MTELLSPPTPHQIGDAVLVRRNDEPAMVEVGDIISRNIADFAPADAVGNINILDSDLTALEDRITALEALVASLHP